jgi:hypothetical protein
MDDIFLGELPQNTDTGTPPAGYDSSGVNPDLEVTEVKDEVVESSNNWIMYLGVGIMAYVLLFKKK